MSSRPLTPAELQLASSARAAVIASVPSTKVLDELRTVVGRAAYQSLGGDQAMSNLRQVIDQAVASYVPQRTMLDAIASIRTTHYDILSRQIFQIESAQDAIRKMSAQLVAGPAFLALYDTVGRYAQAQGQLAELAIRHNDVNVLRGYTIAPERLYDSYLDGLPARPIARRARVAQQAGEAQSGLLVAESLTAGGLTVDDRVELVERFTLTVIEPAWETGPARARDELYIVLGTLDSGRIGDTRQPIHVATEWSGTTSNSGQSGSQRPEAPNGVPFVLVRAPRPLPARRP
jgi:hypothetical protein